MREYIEELRTKKGTFGTSKAARKRKALGISKPPVPVELEITRRAAGYATSNPDLSPEARHYVAGAITLTKDNNCKNTEGQILKVQQALRAGQTMWSIVNAMPKAAKYLVQLVNGTGRARTAPHSVRLQAAVVVLEMGGATRDGAGASGELADMTKDDLLKAIQGINLAISAKGAEDAQEVSQAERPAEAKSVDIEQLA